MRYEAFEVRSPQKQSVPTLAQHASDDDDDAAVSMDIKGKLQPKQGESATTTERGGKVDGEKTDARRLWGEF